MANDINDIIMMTERQLDASTASHAQIERIHSTARHALSGVRKAILELESDRTPSEHEQVDAGSQGGNLYEQAHTYHERLLSAGFHGELLILDDSKVPHGRSMTLAADCLHELFGNISKYAQKSQDYCVIVSSTSTSIGIGVTDVVRDAAETEHGIGSGMQGLSERIQAIGGTVDTDLDGTYWNVQISIPLD